MVRNGPDCVRVFAEVSDLTQTTHYGRLIGRHFNCSNTTFLIHPLHSTADASASPIPNNIIVCGKKQKPSKRRQNHQRAQSIFSSSSSSGCAHRLSRCSRRPGDWRREDWCAGLHLPLLALTLSTPRRCFCFRRQLSFHIPVKQIREDSLADGLSGKTNLSLTPWNKTIDRNLKNGKM